MWLLFFFFSPCDPSLPLRVSQRSLLRACRLWYWTRNAAVSLAPNRWTEREIHKLFTYSLCCWWGQTLPTEFIILSTITWMWNNGQSMKRWTAACNWPIKHKILYGRENRRWPNKLFIVKTIERRTWAAVIINQPPRLPEKEEREEITIPTSEW